MTDALLRDEDGLTPMSVAVSVVASEGDLEALEAAGESNPELAQRVDLARALLAELLRTTGLTGWSTEQLVNLLVCPHPDPNTWLDVRVPLLEQSVAVVTLIREHAEASQAARDVKSLKRYLKWHNKGLNIDDSFDPLLGAVERRTASRESLTLSIEVLSRLKGNVAAARELLFDQDDTTASELIGRDQLGFARSQVVTKLRVLLREERRQALANKRWEWVPVSRRELVADYGIESIEEVEGRAAQDKDVPDVRAEFTPDQILEYVLGRAERK